MNGRTITFGVVAVLLVAGVVGGISLGVGPLSSPGSGVGFAGDSHGDGTSDGSGAASGGGGASSGVSGSGSQGSAGNAADSPESPAFLFRVDQIESCGQTCRDVTATVTSQQNTTVSNVEVVTQIYAKQDKLWEGSQTFDRIGSGASKTRTARVKLGYFDAYKVKRNGGYITVKTTVTWDGGQESFSQRRKVA